MSEKLLKIEVEDVPDQESRLRIYVGPRRPGEKCPIVRIFQSGYPESILISPLGVRGDSMIEDDIKNNQEWRRHHGTIKIGAA